MSRGAGASPATAHWAVAGPPTKVRSSPGASNPAVFSLTLMFCLPLLPSLWPSDRSAGTSSRAHPPSSASTAAVSTSGPRPQPPPPPSREFLDPVTASSDDRTRNVVVIIFRCDRTGVNQCATARRWWWRAPMRSGAGLGVHVSRNMKEICMMVTLGVDRGLV